MWFGNVGLNEWLPDASGATGRVVRTLEAGVRYRAELLEKALPLWKAIPPSAEGRIRYEFPGLPVELGKISHPRSLFDLAEELRPRRRKVKPNDPLLDELDWVVDRLMDTVVKLHAKQLTIGMIHPFNVIWYTTKSGQRVLVLPDVGFIWPNAGFRPTWLADPVELAAKVKKGQVKLSKEANWELLFRQAWYPDPVTTHSVFDAHRDLSAIARLLDWVISGQLRPNIPTKVKDDPTTSDQIYTLLAAVMGKAVKTASDLRKRLTLRPAKGNKPPPSRVSVVFMEPPIIKKKRSMAWLGWLLGFILLAGTLSGGYVYYSTLPDKPPPTAGNELYPALPAESKLRPLLDELKEKLDHPPDDKVEAIEKWLPELVGIVERATLIVKNEPMENEDDQAKERACRDLMWRLVRDQFDKQFDGLLDQLADRQTTPDKISDVTGRALSSWDRFKALAPGEDSSWQPRSLEFIKGAKVEAEIAAKAMGLRR